MTEFVRVLLENGSKATVSKDVAENAGYDPLDEAAIDQRTGAPLDPEFPDESEDPDEPADPADPVDPPAAPAEPAAWPIHDAEDPDTTSS